MQGATVHPRQEREEEEGDSSGSGRPGEEGRREPEKKSTK